MQAELSRLAEQLARALEGEAWHGLSVLEVLAGITAEQAAAHPIAGAHSIWELVLHLCGTYGLRSGPVDLLTVTPFGRDATARGDGTLSAQVVCWGQIGTPPLRASLLEYPGFPWPPDGERHGALTPF